MCLDVLPVPHMHTGPAEVIREHLVPWNWNNRQLLAAMRVLGLQLQYSGREASAFSNCAISLNMLGSKNS